MIAQETVDPAATAVLGSIINAQYIGDGRNLWTVRLVLPPGAEFPYWTRPGPTVVQIESGKLALTAVTGSVELTFGADPITRTKNTKGVEYLLSPGDTAAYGQGVQQSVRNPVTVPTSIIVTMISPADDKPFQGLWTSQGWPVTFV